MPLQKKVAISLLLVIVVLLVSAFLFVPTPRSQPAEVVPVITAITKLRDDTLAAEIPEPQKTTLIKALDQSLKLVMAGGAALEAGNIAKAKRNFFSARTRQLGRYIKILNDLKKQGNVSPGVADPLIQEAEAIITQIEDLTNPFGNLVLQPLIINAGTPKTIFAEISIQDPKLKPASVKLERLDEAGNVIATIGTLRDDGKDGDPVAGDKKFSLQFTLDESTEGLVRVRVSAQFRGAAGWLSSAEERIEVLPLPLEGDTTPEEFVQAATSALLVAQNINEVSQFFDESEFTHLQELVAGGIALADIGKLLQTAHLNWKTERDAEFQITITRSAGETFSSLLILRKQLEPPRWQVVSF